MVRKICPPIGTSVFGRGFRSRSGSGTGRPWLNPPRASAPRAGRRRCSERRGPGTGGASGTGRFRRHCWGPWRWRGQAPVHFEEGALVQGASGDQIWYRTGSSERSGAERRPLVQGASGTSRGGASGTGRSMLGLALYQDPSPKTCVFLHVPKRDRAGGTRPVACPDPRSTLGQSKRGDTTAPGVPA